MTAIAKCADRIVETTIDEEIVVMELDKGEFFSITGTGLAIWRLIDGTRSRAMLHRKLASEFDAPAESLAGDVDAFLEKLSDAGLIEQV